MLANSAHWLHRARLPCEQPVLFGSWPTLALHLDRSPFHPRFAFPLRWMVQGCPSMGNPFGAVKVHRTFTLFRLTIAKAMPLRASGQSALPERPKIPNPGEKSGLGFRTMWLYTDSSILPRTRICDQPANGSSRFTRSLLSPDVLKSPCEISAECCLDRRVQLGVLSQVALQS